MDILKEPAIIFCIILFFIIICVAVYLYRNIIVLSERTDALESVLGTLTKEGNDFREKSKRIESLIGAANSQHSSLENLNNTMITLTKELKEQRKYINYLTSKLTESGISDIKPYRSGAKPKTKAKKSVSFDTDSESEESESEIDSRDVKKALKAKKGKRD